MIISKELFTGKELADGSHPIAIRISHKGRMKRIFTSVSCKKKNWHRSRLCVLNKDPDFRLKNETVETTLRRVSAGVQDHIDRCLDRDFELLAESIGNNPDMPASRLLPTFSLASVADKKAESAGKLNTRRGYESFARYIRSRFGERPDINEIDQSFVNQFIKTIESDYPDLNSMRIVMVNRLKAVLAFASAAGWHNSPRPFTYPKYVVVSKDRNCTLQELRLIAGIMSRNLSGGVPFLTESTLSLAIFVLDIAFQGIAPVDLATLKIKDLVYKDLYDVKTGRRLEVVAIDTSRRKTGNPVRIVVYAPPIKPIIAALTNGRPDDGYLIPCFDNGKAYSDKQRHDRLANYFHKMTELMNREISLECERTETTGMRRVTYYCARHAFCNLADGLDIPHHLIRKMEGHRQTVLERSYLSPPSDVEQALVSESILSLIGLECP